MTRSTLLKAVLLAVAAAGSLQAQPVLRPGPSGRALSEVTLAYPRPAPAPGTVAGTAPAPSAAPATATPPASAPSTAGTMTAMPAGGAAMSGAMTATAATPAAKPIVIRLDYGQPHLRGRVLHGDSLVPYDKPWRLGANSPTTLTTDVDLIVGGTTLTKGTYVLYALPGRTAWKLIVQRSAQQSAMEYKQADDVARIDLRHSTLPTPFESLTMWLIPSRDPGPARGELRFAWGTDQLSTTWSIK